ncbi:hypothetical protein F5887DRAFT_1026951 [Amanita rubescens]|nr:hypothetical protein F5887DRAFT_1026951 [Amanita rubescens]
MMRRRNVIPFDFLEANSSFIAATVWDEDNKHGRVGIYITNKWTSPRMVPVPFKEPMQSTDARASPDFFSLDAWIKVPNTPPHFYWTRVTKQCDNYIVHYMMASTHSLSNSSLTTRIEYIGDILMLKLQGDLVVNVTDADLDHAMEVLDDFL